MALDDRQLETWHNLLRTHAWINMQLAQSMLREDGIRINAYEVLVYLQQCDPPSTGLRMQDLIDRVVITNSGMTRLIDRMVNQGLVERCTNEADRREVYVRITPAGDELVTRLREHHQQRVHELFLKHLSEEELSMLSRIYQRVQKANNIPAVTQVHSQNSAVNSAET